MNNSLLTVLSAALILCLPGCDNPTTSRETGRKDSPVKTSVKSIPSYFNADSLQAYYSSPPLSYYFIKHDSAGAYSTYNGYVSKEVAESTNEGNRRGQEIEIQFNPETKEIYRARLSIHNLKSIYPKPSDLKYALQFVAIVSPAAAGQFERNFQKIFGDYLNDTPIDSNKYIDNDKKLTIEIQDDFDLVAKKESEISNAFIEISILNLENLRECKLNCVSV